MRKRFVALMLALCALFPCFPALSAGAAEALDDIAGLSLLFPGAHFEPLDDFYYRFQAEEPYGTPV